MAKKKKKSKKRGPYINWDNVKLLKKGYSENQFKIFVSGYIHGWNDYGKKESKKT